MVLVWGPQSHFEIMLMASKAKMMLMALMAYKAINIILYYLIHEDLHGHVVFALKTTTEKDNKGKFMSTIKRKQDGSYT